MGQEAQAQQAPQEEVQLTKGPLPDSIRTGLSLDAQSSINRMSRRFLLGEREACNTGKVHKIRSGGANDDGSVGEYCTAILDESYEDGVVGLPWDRDHFNAAINAANSNATSFQTPAEKESNSTPHILEPARALDAGFTYAAVNYSNGNIVNLAAEQSPAEVAQIVENCYEQTGNYPTQTCARIGTRVFHDSLQHEVASLGGISPTTISVQTGTATQVVKD